MKVKEAMHIGVESALPTTPVAQVAKMMAEHDIGAVPIVDTDGMRGIVTDRDIACRALANGKSPSEITAKEIMTESPIYCRETEEIDDAVHLMENKQIRRLPVLDQDDKLVGMLSLGDIAHATSQDMAGEIIKAVSAHHEDPQLLGSAD